jgi:hypothetical protein
MAAIVIVSLMVLLTMRGGMMGGMGGMMCPM